MTFEAFWLKLINKNPKLADPKLNTVEITKKNFELILRQAHSAGFEEGKSSKSLFDQPMGDLPKK